MPSTPQSHFNSPDLVCTAHSSHRYVDIAQLDSSKRISELLTFHPAVPNRRRLRTTTCSFDPRPSLEQKEVREGLGRRLVTERVVILVSS